MCKDVGVNAVSTHLAPRRRIFPPSPHVSVHLSVYVCVCLTTCVREFVCVCVCVRAHARVRACARVCVSPCGRYDLKGSTVGRKVSEFEKEQATTIYKDLDFFGMQRKLELGSTRRQAVLEQIKVDCDFLQSIGDGREVSEAQGDRSEVRGW